MSQPVKPKTGAAVTAIMSLALPTLVLCGVVLALSGPGLLVYAASTGSWPAVAAGAVAIVMARAIVTVVFNAHAGQAQRSTMERLAMLAAKMKEEG